MANGLDAPKILDIIKNHVVEVHLKDVGAKNSNGSRSFVPLGTGEVNLKESIKILKSFNYTGWVHVENNYSIELLTKDFQMIINEFEIA